MKMETTHVSETSTLYNHTPGNYPKEDKIRFSQHGESLKTRLRVMSKKFGEGYQKTNKTEDANKLTLLAFKIIATLHNTLLATFIKLLETVSKGLF
jgi:hypothetical protein